MVRNAIGYVGSVITFSGISITLVYHCVFEWNQLTGFSLPLLLTIPSSLYYVIRFSGDVELLMVSVSRILNYCSLVQENTNSSLKHFQESEGSIELRNASFRYSRDLPNSLTTCLCTC